jgi:hypothetical protein
VSAQKFALLPGKIMDREFWSPDLLDLALETLLIIGKSLSINLCGLLFDSAGCLPHVN